MCGVSVCVFENVKLVRSGHGIIISNVVFPAICTSSGELLLDICAIECNVVYIHLNNDPGNRFVYPMITKVKDTQYVVIYI